MAELWRRNRGSGTGAGVDSFIGFAARERKRARDADARVVSFLLMWFN